jgi:endoglucanase
MYLTAILQIGVGMALLAASCGKKDDDRSPPIVPPKEDSGLNLNQRQPRYSSYLNQFTYQPEHAKRVVFLASDHEVCSVFDRNGKQLLHRPLRRFTSHPDYPVELASCDLSDLKEKGVYTLKLGDTVQKLTLAVEPNGLQPLLEASMRSYYFQRASFALDKRFAGIWARPAGHPDKELAIRLTGSDRDGNRWDVPGGWYDAGDYGKYVVNGGITIGTLLMTAEDFPQAIDDKLGIPESNNGRSDLLDEVKYELDWFLTMQDKDGGVFFKVGPLEWPGFIMPHDDIGERFVTGKSTSSTLNFAAACAQASRVFRMIDPDYAATLLGSAERAWNWAMRHPEVLPPEPDPAGTGSYYDEDFADEFLWAAVELARTTGAQRYRQDAETRLLGTALKRGQEALWWQNVEGLAFLSAAHESFWSQDVLNHVRQEIVQYADGIHNTAADNPFGIAYTGRDFIWGSNGGLANQGMVLLIADRLTNSSKYRQSAQDIIHYLLGRNIHGLSFVTGFGQSSSQYPHHRPSGGDRITPPIPGFLVGGPNFGRNDKGSQVNYPTNPEGPYSYTDQRGSYASNEVAINWNAPFTYLLAGMLYQ